MKIEVHADMYIYGVQGYIYIYIYIYIFLLYIYIYV